MLNDGPADAPARQQTLRAAIAWSYDLLSEKHQAAFRRLAVFAGGATLDGVVSVLDDGDPFGAIDALEALVDQGLLLRSDTSDGEPRFRMLETVREYASERLTDSGEADPVRAAHAGYMLAVAEKTRPNLFGPDPGLWLDRLDREQDNIRAALAWSLGDTKGPGDVTLALRMAAACYQFWHMRGHLQEGHSWLERAIGQGERVDPATRADAFLTLANIANNLEDHDQARALYLESLRLNKEIGNTPGIAAALVGLGMVATNEGAFSVARTYLDEGHAVYHRSGSPTDTIPSHYAFARLAVAQGNYDDAERHLEDARRLSGDTNVGFLTYLSLEMAHLERYRGNLIAASDMVQTCLARFRDMGERRAEATCLGELGHHALHRGELPAAADHFLAAAAMHLEMRDELGLIQCVEGLATFAASQDRANAAATLIGAADAWRERTSTVRICAEREIRDRLVASLRVALSGDVLQAELGHGRAMGIDQAIQLAKRTTLTT